MHKKLFDALLLQIANALANCVHTPAKLCTSCYGRSGLARD